MLRKPRHPAFAFAFKPLTAGHEAAAQAYSKADVLVILGPAGSGKTHLALGLAFTDLLAGRFDRIVLTRPAVEAGERLGFLPGGPGDKLGPYIAPVWDCLGRMVFKLEEDALKDVLVPEALAFMRGRTFSRAAVILDEAQNCKESQLDLAVTRMGSGSKTILTGDPDQTDLEDGSPLLSWVDSIRGVEGVEVVVLGEADVVRHPTVARIVRARSLARGRR